MDDSRKELLSQEATALVSKLIASIQKQYSALRDAYEIGYGWPNLDPIRSEAALCLILELPQAAITLTNHLLESLLKETLITHHSMPTVRDFDGDAVDAIIEGTAEARAMFGDALMGTTINAVKTAGLISKAQAKQLYQLRDHFRNPYSHGDKAKIFRDATVPVQAVKVMQDGTIAAGESRVVRVADFPIAQGLIQALIAQIDALEYFSYVDSLARELRAKLFPEAEPPASS